MKKTEDKKIQPEDEDIELDPARASRFVNEFDLEDEDEEDSPKKTPK